jgi:hypothetical protein
VNAIHTWGWAGAVLASALMLTSATVTITKAPPAGKGADSRGNIEGRVEGLPNPDTYRVVIYAHTDRWYIQPEVDSPFTNIDAKGHWTNWTHLGGRYAALVVRPSYKPAPELRALPPIGGDVIAQAEAPASSR